MRRSRLVSLLILVAAVMALLIPASASAGNVGPTVASDGARTEGFCFGPWYRASNGLMACYGRQAIYWSPSHVSARKGTIYFYGNPLWFQPTTGWITTNGTYNSNLMP